MRREYRQQEPPFCVTPELTTGCNLACSFCAVAGIQEKQGHGYKFMSSDTINSLMWQVHNLGWKSRIEFAMRGEPTMHPDYVNMVRITHANLPKAHKLIISNASGLLRKPGPVTNITALFDAGLNVLALDNYVGVQFVEKVLAKLEEHGPLVSGQMHPLGFRFWSYPQDLAGNPHHRRPPGTRMLVVIRDISVQHAERKTGNHGKLFNYAGVGAPKNDSMAGKRCHHPFRQLAVHSDGNVAICCNDWRGVYHCGNVVTDGVAAVWQSQAMGAAREMLFAGKREMEPCKGCDHRSYRVGLLPDLLGAKKGEMHAPDKQTAEDVAAALALPPYSPVVLRPWEK